MSELEETVVTTEETVADPETTIVTVSEMKNYLRVDYNEDDALIGVLINAAQKQCMDMMRVETLGKLEESPNGKLAVMFTTAYFYEHREEADHHALDLTLRALLFGDREVKF